MKILKVYKAMKKSLAIPHPEPTHPQLKFHPAFWILMAIMCLGCCVISYMAWFYLYVDRYGYSLWFLGGPEEPLWISLLQDITPLLMIAILFKPFGKLLGKMGLIKKS